MIGPGKRDRRGDASYSCSSSSFPLSLNFSPVVSVHVNAHDECNECNVCIRTHIHMHFFTLQYVLERGENVSQEECIRKVSSSISTLGGDALRTNDPVLFLPLPHSVAFYLKDSLAACRTYKRLLFPSPHPFAL